MAIDYSAILQKYGPLIDAGGRVASGIESGRASGRAAEGTANNQYDLLRLAAARLNLEAPSERARNSVRGDILASAQPSTITGPITGTHGQVPQISGGLSPALLSGNSRQLGGAMSRDALLSQMQGDVVPQPQPQSNGIDTALSGAGYASLLAPILGQLFKPKSAPTLGGMPTAPLSGNVQMPQFPRMPWQGSFGGMAL